MIQLFWITLDDEGDSGFQRFFQGLTLGAVVHEAKGWFGDCL